MFHNFEGDPFAASSPAISLEQALDVLARYAGDKAHHGRIKTALQNNGAWGALGLPAPVVKKDGPPPPFPAPNRITAIQTAIFDNWPDGRPPRGSPNQYGAAIEVWTAEKDNIHVTRKRDYQHKTQCSLMDARALKAQIKALRKSRKTPLDQTYVDYLEQMLPGLEENRGLIGLINTSVDRDEAEYGRGVYYHADQFILMRIEKGRVVQAMLMLEPGGDPIELAPFDPLDAAGKRHGGKVILQSRHDRCEFSSAWRTNKSE